MKITAEDFKEHGCECGDSDGDGMKYLSEEEMLEDSLELVDYIKQNIDDKDIYSFITEFICEILYEIDKYELEYLAFKSIIKILNREG